MSALTVDHRQRVAFWAASETTAVLVGLLNMVVGGAAQVIPATRMEVNPSSAEVAAEVLPSPTTASEVNPVPMLGVRKTNQAMAAMAQLHRTRVSAAAAVVAAPILEVTVGYLVAREVAAT